VNTFTVVIPALNAATTLPATLAAIGRHAVVVVDGGSTDATVVVARDAGAHTVAAPPGRGGQLAAGIAAAATPWVLLLHADTRLAPGWRDVVARHIEFSPDRAGYFSFVIDSADPRARRLERLVAWRCRALALPYGDQGLLISRALLDSVGGMNLLPLMEDVDLARRLGCGRLRSLQHPAITSAARWERDGWLRRSARNLLCLAMYRAGVPTRVIQQVYR